MAKELYLYSPLYSYVAETANKELSLIPDSEELTVRFNTPGGETNAGFAFLSKLQERKTPKTAIIDGEAMSMGAFMLPFFDHVIANDTSSIMFHKAAYYEWYKPSESELAKLKATNELFKQKLTAKVAGKKGAEEFIDKVFEADVRNDVDITPKKALELGIVNEIRKIEPTAMLGMQMVAMVDEGQELKAVKKTPQSSGELDSNLKNESMNLVELKAKFPAVYAQARKEGADQELDRVGSWMAFNEIDPVKVKAGIESGLPVGQKATAEFTVQSMQKGKLEAIEGENTPDLELDPEAKTPEQIKAAADQKGMDDLFNEGTE